MRQIVRIQFFKILDNLNIWNIFRLYQFKVKNSQYFVTDFGICHSLVVLTQFVKWGWRLKSPVYGIRAQLSQKQTVVNVQEKKKFDRENAQKNNWSMVLALASWYKFFFRTSQLFVKKFWSIPSEIFSWRLNLILGT